MTQTPTPTIPAVEPIKVVGMVLQNQMSLADGQIMLAFENWEIPENPGLYVSLAYGAEFVIGNDNYNGVDDQGNYIEIQDVAMLHQVVIDVLSFDSSARTRKEEVLQALASSYSQNLMETYSMRIASTPGSFTTITSPEPTKQLNRYQLTIAVNALHRKVLTAAYFDSLKTVKLVVNP